MTTRLPSPAVKTKAAIRLPDNLAVLKANRSYLSQIITHRFGVDEIKKAFELFYKGETGKVVIVQ